MKKSVAFCSLVIAAAAQGQGAVPEFVRSEFGIRVLTNTVASSGTGGDLASLAIGEEGVFTIDVNPDDSLYISDNPGFYQTYQVLDVGVQIGAISSGATPGVYPSGPSFVQGLGIENDFAAAGQISDSMAMIPSFANPSIGFSAFAIFQRLPFGQTPGMFTSLDLPLSIDASLITTPVDFSLGSPLNGATRVSFDVFSATVTYIPAPYSAALLAFAGLSGSSRRR